MRSLRHALRALEAQPVFCGTTVSTLAFGVGFNALMFSAVHGVFLRPLPFPGDETLIAVEVRDQRLGTNIRATPADFFDWREQATTFSQLGAYTSSDLHVFSGDDASRRSGATVTVGFFETLGSKPVLGRLLEARDFVPGSPGSVVISESFWRREFGAHSSVLESALEVTSRPYRIVGVVPEEVRLDTRAELWVPMAIERSQASRQARFLRVIGRLESAAGRQMAEAEMATIGRRIASEFPNTHSHTDIRISSLRAVLLGDFPGKITTLWGAVASVLLMICANLGLLLLSSSARRSA